MDNINHNMIISRQTETKKTSSKKIDIKQKMCTSSQNSSKPNYIQGFSYEELLRDPNKVIDLVCLNENEEEKCKTLSKICKKLIEIKNFKAATKGAESMSHKDKEEPSFILDKQDKIVTKICKELIKIKDFDAAIHAAKIMPYTLFQSKILKKICAKLLQTENFNQAIEVAQIIPTNYGQCIAFEMICTKLIEVKEFDRAKSLIALLPNDAFRNFEYKSIWRRLTDLKCIIQSIIFDGLLKIEKVENAIELALEVQNDDMLEEISSTFAENHHIEPAPRLHRKPLFSQKRIYSLIEIFQTLIKIGKEEIALKILEKMTNKEEKSTILDSLYKK